MKTNDTKSKNKIFLAIILLAILVIAAIVMYMVFKQKTSQGSKAITVSVVYDDGSQDDYKIRTDAEYLRDVTDEIEELEIDGHYDGTSFYIDAVNGVTADYDADGAYWAIYVDGEYGNYGFEKQPVADGAAYEIRYEVWTE
ncbi:MAG: DUF4430 domain-containing protein [Hespellia sp.]|jgi:hypothetical protein|nr:DUF4430 domain-containing protein [Hespellia sp.]